MKKFIFFLVSICAFNLNAQHTISGTFTPAEDYTWLIAYRLKPGTQVYAADTAIKNGAFTMTLPENAEPGTYRLVYAVPQEEYNFDIIYNGKEDIIFNFNSDDGASFKSSTENTILNEYEAAIATAEQNFISYYTNQEQDEQLYQNLIQEILNKQERYEEKSNGLLAYHFIKANKPYMPTKLESVQDYVHHKKEHYFDAIDFNNTVLQSSGFLKDKLANFVFTALPLTADKVDLKEAEINKNIVLINSHIEQLSASFKFHIYNDLWNYAVVYGYNSVSDFIYNTYLNELAKETNNVEIKNAIEAHNRLRLGEVAPEIIWKKGTELLKLSGLNGATNYVLVFWSSTCGHCIKELPALHKELSGKNKIKVLAIGLEDDTENWKQESKNLTNFEHAISLGKWDSEYADLYDIHATPTYFILDNEKRIIAKPENDKAVVEFLEKIY